VTPRFTDGEINRNVSITRYAKIRVKVVCSRGTYVIRPTTTTTTALSPRKSARRGHDQKRVASHAALSGRPAATCHSYVSHTHIATAFVSQPTVFCIEYEKRISSSARRNAFGRYSSSTFIRCRLRRRRGANGALLFPVNTPYNEILRNRQFSE